MVDEVGPNDPNRGRSSIGGFKMPGSKPIEVRGLDDVHTAGFGGFRKPKPKEEYTQGSPDIAGGGYTAAQTTTDRPKLMAVFLGVPVLFLAGMGLLGWYVFGGVPTPLSSTCGADGYTATYNRADFHQDATSATIDVEFVDANGVRSANTGRIAILGSATDTLTVDARVTPLTSSVPVTCEVTAIELLDE